MNKFYSDQGIIHQTSCINTLQQNGRIKRKHHHVLNVVRTLRFQANLPIEFCLIDRTLSPILKRKTPYETFFKSLPSYDHLWVFGCLCYAYKHQIPKDKFESRSRKCIFIGYPHAKKGRKVYDLETGEVFISRDVIFDESTFHLMKVRKKISSKFPSQ